MVDMTLNELYAKVKVIHFGTNRFVIYDFLGENDWWSSSSLGLILVDTDGRASVTADDRRLFIALPWLNSKCWLDSKRIGWPVAKIWPWHELMRGEFGTWFKLRLSLQLSIDI